MGGYPFDHRSGFAAVPRAVATFEPVMLEPSGVLARLYLLIYCRATHEPRWARGSHGNVWLETGECILGVREAATQLGISKNAAARGLKELERLGLITRKAGQLGSVVSVPFYGCFGENVPVDRDSTGDTPRDSTGDTPRDSTGDTPRDSTGPLSNGRTGERKKRENGETLSLVADERVPQFDLEAVYRRYPRKQGKAGGMKAAAKLIRTEADYEQLRQAVERMAQLWIGATREQLRFCPHWSSYVNGARWRDEEQPAPQRIGPPPVRDRAREILEYANRIEAAENAALARDPASRDPRVGWCPPAPHSAFDNPEEF